MIIGYLGPRGKHSYNLSPLRWLDNEGPFGLIPTFWLVGNGRRVIIVVIIVPHSSIPY